MKDLKFKKCGNEYYSMLRECATNWVNKHCNNGTATLKGLRLCYDWKEAFIVLCKGTYMAVPETMFNSVQSIK